METQETLEEMGMLLEAPTAPDGTSLDEAPLEVQVREAFGFDQAYPLLFKAATQGLPEGSEAASNLDEAWSHVWASLSEKYPEETFKECIELMQTMGLCMVMTLMDSMTRQQGELEA